MRPVKVKRSRRGGGPQGAILRALAAGAVITAEYVKVQPQGTKCTYRLSSTGALIRRELFERMLNDCLIKPNADGLFGNDGPAQSYSLFRASEGGA